MKKVAAVFFAVACVAAVVVVLATLALGLRRQELHAHPPLTHQELELLYQKVNSSNEPDKARAPGAAGDSANEVASGDPLIAAVLPRRLNRTLTDKERHGWYTSDLNVIERIASHIEYTPLACLAYYVLGGSNINTEQAELFYSGKWNLVQRNWPAAKSCFSELARKSNGLDQFACAYLAELEDDPELAARYMELASKGEHPHPLLMCRNLARATGSNELAAYYGKLYEEKLAKQQRPLQERQ